MSKEGTILIVDDNKSILSTLNILLNSSFKDIITTNTPNSIESSLRSKSIDVILLDMNFTVSVNTGNEGLFWLSKIKEIAPDVPVVLFTAYADIDLAVEGIKRGATDFVVKPWDNAKLIATLQNACALHRSRKHNNTQNTSNKAVKELSMYWGSTQVMTQLLDTINKVAPTDANMLITGENGTGKEMLVKEIHNHSARANKPLVTVDMGAITETLFESELFGHVKGSFTDAKSDRAGKFEVADGGTLFLDEIGNLPLHLQSKLLSVLQTNTITRVGSNKSQAINIRLICATNCDLLKSVSQGSFREDLLYRINTVHVEIPPLRQRQDDIIPLAERFLEEYSSKYNRHVKGFDDLAKEEMLKYAWKGNIRELRHTIEKAVIICDSEYISPSSLLLMKEENDGQSLIASRTTLEEMEKSMIENAINQNNGKMSAVASQLGITRQTLYNKIKRYGL